jgi:FkbM family methyltransferase
MLSINKKNYHCNPDDYDFIHIQEFCNLKIYKKIGELERYSGLLNDLTDIFSNPTLFIYGLKYSSFIANNCYSKYFHINIINDDDMIEYENTSINIDDLEMNSKVSIVNHYDGIDKNSILFLFDNQIIDDSISINKPLILCSEYEEYNNLYEYRYKLSKSNYFLYVSKEIYSLFLQEFHYYIDNNILNYDNLIHLCIMVKNGGDDFKNMLIQNLPIIDRWTILDTGSTDNTLQNINDILVGKKKGKLFQEPFINFRESRNRCLELSEYTCKYRIMLDDTYVIQGRCREFLEICRGDQFADSYSLLIKSGDTSYYSNRVTKSLNNLKYIYTIHEVIQKDDNVNVVIPDNWSWIFDMRSDYMEQRTMDRKRYDLEQLFLMVEEYPDDPRHLYYIAQTYNLLGEYEKAAEFFYKRAMHPIEGFDQEKVDALFEMTRQYNFQLNKPWDECEKWYKLVHEWDPERPEASYFLGIHYYLEGDMKTAYEYFTRGFKIGFPIHRQYSLKPTLSYHFLPKFLAQLCYQFNNPELGFQATSLFLKHNKPDDDEYENMLSFHNIFNMINSMPPLKDNPQIPHMPVFCFVADGGFKKWSGSSIIKEGVGGSETYIIEMARYIKKYTNYEVVVFCNCEQSEIFEGVKYLPLHQFLKYASELEIEHCIISRFAEYIPVAIRGYIKNIHLVIHDLTMSGNIIPVHSKIKNVFCLTEWHKRYFLERFSQFTNVSYGFHYGIDFTHFQYRNEPKINNSFIYSSFPNRGLLVLLRMWPRILNRYPDATLNIFCDMNNHWSNTNFPEEMNIIRGLLPDLQNKGVTNHGWVSKATLGQYWRQSQIWFYPCKFKETFCLTALEAALSKTFAITNNLASLEDTVGNRGVSIEGDVMEDEWQNKTFEVICEYMDNPEKMNEYIDKNYEWALEHSWENRAIKLLEHIHTFNPDEYDREIKITENPIYLENIGKLYCYEDDFMKHIFLKDGDWEPELNDIFKRYINKNSIVVDIGASIGINTIKMSKFAKKVYSFEPFTQSFELLNTNISINNLDNVETFNYGLGNEEKNIDKMWFGFLNKKKNMGTLRINKLYNLYNEPVDVNIKIKKLDNILNEPIDFIKIDVEGFENEVLLGAMNIITKYKPIIIMENWNIDNEYDILQNLGYSMFRLNENVLYIYFNKYDILKIGANTGKLKNDPFFTQINANHKCIFIEPIKEYYDELVNNYNDKCPNNNFIFLNEAISQNNDEITLYYPSKDNEYDKLPWWINQLASSNMEHIKNHGYLIKLDNIKMKPKTINDIIDEYKINELYILQIDTEGFDYEILMAMDLNKLRPKYIEFEHLHMDGHRTTGEKYKKLLKHFRKYGYTVKLKDEDDTILEYGYKYELDYTNMYNWTNDLPFGYNSKQTFLSMLDLIKNKNARILEVGTFSGTSLINMLEYLPDSEGTAIDKWMDYDEFFDNQLLNNLKNITKNKTEQLFYDNVKVARMEDRIEVLKGNSIDKLCELIEQKREFDFIYVDGSHLSYDTFVDCVLSWKLLSKEGILAIDDYEYKIDQNCSELEKPYEGINQFLKKYKGEYEVLNIGYRVFLRKI